MEPSFRLATEDDATLLLEMMREYYAYDGHAFDAPKARIALLAFLREPSFGLAWLICEDSTPVGYIVLTLGYSLEFLGRDAFIDEFYLRESHRGRGWGEPRTLVRRESRPAGLSVRSIHLEVVRQNTAAKEVYRKSGYLDHDHYLMSKWIEPAFPKPGSGSVAATTAARPAPRTAAGHRSPRRSAPSRRPRTPATRRAARAAGRSGAWRGHLRRRGLRHQVLSQ